MKRPDRLAFLILAAFVARMAHAAPAPSRSVVDVDDATPTIDGVAAAADRARRAVPNIVLPSDRDRVDELMKIETYMDDRVEMGNARIHYSEPAVWRWRRRALLDRRGLYPAFCATGVRLLSHVSPARARSMWR